MRQQNGKAVIRLASGLLALPSVLSAAFWLRVDTDFRVVSYGLVSILLWFAIERVIRAALTRYNRRLAVISCLMGFGLALAMVAGSALYQYGDARLGQLKTWVGVLCALPLFASAVALLIDRLPAAAWPAPNWLERLDGKAPTGRRYVLIVWALVLLAWLPGLIASYPGVYGYDCVYQIDNYLTGQIMNCHPVAHTYLLGFCVVTLGGLLGSREAGMCVYSVLQMIAFSGAFAAVLGYLRRRGAPKLLQLVSLLLAMFLPTNAIMSFSGTKDVFFATFLTLTALVCLDIAREPELLKQRAVRVKLVLFAFVMMIFRNPAVYLFALAMLVGLIVLRGQRKRVTALLLCGLACFALYDGVLCPYVFKVVDIDGPQESLSVPCVQLSRAMWESGDELPPEDSAAIEAYLPDWRNYTEASWGIADPEKATFNKELYHQDELAFFSLWARVGAQCPGAYINAFLRLNIGLWYPDMPYPDRAAYHPYFEYNNTDIPGDWVELKRATPSWLRPLADFYRRIAYTASYQRVPVLSLLWSSGLAAWLVLLFAARAVYARRYRLLFPAALWISLWAGLLFGPVVLLRYTCALFMCQPLLLCELGAKD